MPRAARSICCACIYELFDVTWIQVHRPEAVGDQAFLDSVPLHTGYALQMSQALAEFPTDKQGGLW